MKSPSPVSAEMVFLQWYLDGSPLGSGRRRRARAGGARASLEKQMKQMLIDDGAVTEVGRELGDTHRSPPQGHALAGISHGLRAMLSQASRTDYGCCSRTPHRAMLSQALPASCYENATSSNS